MTWLYLPPQAWSSPDTVLWVTSSGTSLVPEKRIAGNQTVNLADQALGWPTPKESDGSKSNASKPPARERWRLQRRDSRLEGGRWCQNRKRKPISTLWEPVSSFVLSPSFVNFTSLMPKYRYPTMTVVASLIRYPSPAPA